MTIDNLAGMIKSEFDNIGGEIKEIKSEIKEIKGELKGIKEDIKLRPTKSEIFAWADERIVSLELKADRHDYLHIDELDKLPPQAEISQALVEKGLKPKMA